MLQAIETRYKGYRFRSRLEARWAVFFDTLGATWEYEAQGMKVSRRLFNPWANEHFNYLPDFWLPKAELYCEVKGSLSSDELFNLLDAAASLSSNDGSGCHDAGGHDLLLLGQIPEPKGNEMQRFPVRLHMHKGDLRVLAWPIEDGCEGVYGTIANDTGEMLYSPDGVRSLLQGRPHMDAWKWSRSRHFKHWLKAFTAARSARFEHGESGAT